MTQTVYVSPPDIKQFYNYDLLTTRHYDLWDSCSTIERMYRLIAGKLMKKCRHSREWREKTNALLTEFEVVYGRTKAKEIEFKEAGKKLEPLYRAKIVDRDLQAVCKRLRQWLYRFKPDGENHAIHEI